ncbi:MAG: hypothetical protein QXP36_13055 [Conexivisphaerales archaeon]
MDKKDKVAVALTAAGLTGLGLYLYLSKKVSAISTPITTYTPASISTPTPTPTSTPSYGQIIGPITSNTTMTINTPHVLVVAVGGGGAGGGTGPATAQGGNGGNTVVTNGSQTITAGGGQGGWSGNTTAPSTGELHVCIGCIIGPGGAGGTGSVENVQYYQILNGNNGSTGLVVGGQGGPLPGNYNQAIHQVLEESGIIYLDPLLSTLFLQIPSTSCTTTYGECNPGSGYGAGGCGNWTGGLAVAGGGGSGAVVVGIMNGGTFNITVGQGGQLTPGLEYRFPTCSAGLPGVVYLVPLP